MDAGKNAILRRSTESLLRLGTFHDIVLVYTPNREGGDIIAITSASLPAKKRILTVCVRLFLE